VSHAAHRRTTVLKVETEKEMMKWSTDWLLSYTRNRRMLGDPSLMMDTTEKEAHQQPAADGGMICCGEWRRCSMMMKPRAKAAHGHREQVCARNRRMASGEGDGRSLWCREKAGAKGEEASLPWGSHSHRK
jgi:hypothetical protein